MPKIIDHDQRRLEIVLATKKLIIDGGFRAATMREIAAAAGYANGALKRYFEGKDEILMATSQYATAVLVERLQRTVSGLQGMDAVSAIFEQTLPDRQDNKELARVLLTFWEQSIGNLELSKAFLRNLSPWRNLAVMYLHQAVSLGQLHSRWDDPSTVADELLTLTVGAHVMVQLDDREEIIQQHAGHLRRRISELRADVPEEAAVN
ncbi:TetR/AcrR family transcriptional regulator [Glutamicibacter creatinolyticus]|uniref:TetR/AcrR family transcriptional regulator n=1 Tax=Glutamicibacter creatinolyticus TaxID=162496 RepID=UPI003216FF34